MKKYEANVEQLELLMVKEGESQKHIPAKRVDIVSVKLVKEKSLLYKNRVIRSPEDAYELGKQYLGNVDREHFVVAGLDVKNRPTNITTCHIGSLNASIVSMRETFKIAVLSNSASIICYHNHPSGIADPSPEDIEITKRLVKAGDILGIDLLDHIILGDGEFVSLKEKGYI